jgi:hypothetical protein
MSNRVAFYQQIIDRRKSEGTAAIEKRLAALPTRIRNLARAARELAAGNEDAACVLLRAEAFEPNLLTPGKRLVERLAIHTAGVRFYLYGAGRHTARLLMEKSRWEQHGHKLVGLIDDHPRFSDQPEAYGLPVMPAAAAALRLGADYIVVLSSDAFEEQFWTQTAVLRISGVRVYKLYG